MIYFLKLENLKFLDGKKNSLENFDLGYDWFILKLLGQNIEIRNIGYSIDENKEIQIFFRWIYLSNEISKIKWVNKYMIICGSGKKIIRFQCMGWFLIVCNNNK